MPDKNKPHTLRNSIAMAEEVRNTTFTFNEAKSAAVLEKISAQIEQKQDEEKGAFYRPGNYRFTL